MGAPLPPYNVTAKPADGKVSLTWNAPETNGENVTGYVVTLDFLIDETLQHLRHKLLNSTYRMTNPGCPFSQYEEESPCNYSPCIQNSTGHNLILCKTYVKTYCTNAINHSINTLPGCKQFITASQKCRWSLLNRIKANISELSPHPTYNISFPIELAPYATSTTIHGLFNGMKYKFIIAAKNKNGFGRFSNTSNAV